MGPSSFSTKDELNLHLVKHLNMANKCGLCDKILRDEHTLKCHVRTVHGEKKFSCDLCGKKFPHLGVLNAHKKTHSNLSFKCKVCNETFKDSSYFKKHVRSHSGSRPHSCPVCGKSYLQHSHLKVHMSLHTKDKPYQCDSCQKTFRLAKSFREHLNMHQKVKNFQCSTCPYSTCFRKNLHAHMKNHLRKQDIEKKAMRSKADEVKTVPKARKVVPEKIKPDSGLGLEVESPVYLLVDVSERDGSLREQIFSMEDIETLDPLEMAQELSITTQPDPYSEKFQCDEYRPLDLSVVPSAIRCHPDKLTLNLKNDGSFFSENSGEESPGFPGEGSSFSTRTGEHFPGFSLRSGGSLEYETRSGENSPGLNGRFLDFSVDNNVRRRSVFLAEQLEYEHQGEMRVVDPAEVTG